MVTGSDRLLRRQAVIRLPLRGQGECRPSEPSAEPKSPTSRCGFGDRRGRGLWPGKTGGGICRDSSRDRSALSGGLSSLRCPACRNDVMHYQPGLEADSQDAKLSAFVNWLNALEPVSSTSRSPSPTSR